MRDPWSDVLVTSFREVMERLSHVAPRLLAVLTLIAVGWAVAAVARRLVVRICRDAGRGCPLRPLGTDGRLGPRAASGSPRRYWSAG